jgi:hypothetical protein
MFEKQLVVAHYVESGRFASLSCWLLVAAWPACARYGRLDGNLAGNASNARLFLLKSFKAL